MQYLGGLTGTAVGQVGPGQGELVGDVVRIQLVGISEMRERFGATVKIQKRLSQHEVPPCEFRTGLDD